MSLFPAYAPEDGNLVSPNDSSSTGEKCDLSLDIPEISENQLLASDDEQSRESSDTMAESKLRVRERSPLKHNEDFYLDTKLDPGNLWVSTLYYPGRPQYNPRAVNVPRAKSRRARRYYESRADDVDDASEAAERVAAYRRSLADQPQDVDLWMQFIRFQERCNGGQAASRAAEEACVAIPRSAALRSLRLELARRHLPPERHIAELRDLIVDASCPSLKLELWSRLLWALARSPAACSQPALAAAASAALRDTVAAPAAYPRLLYVYGSFLRWAGLWEQLTLLLELSLSMSLPPSSDFPPPTDRRHTEREEALVAAEETAISSGMPMSAVWVRVERLRAATHWRCDRAAADASADPQRAPAPADLADLLLPLADNAAVTLLIVNALRLVKVPLLPASQWAQAAAHGPTAGCLSRAGCGADCGSALLPLLRAARRLPVAHPAHTAHPARALPYYLQPPHYFDDTGLLSWVEALWQAALGWTAGRTREAMLCWRLRWLHALVLLRDTENESDLAEVRRLRGAARSSLKQFAGSGALPFLQFARLERGAGDTGAALRVAWRALAAACRDTQCLAADRLYGARVVREVGTPAAARWALLCAVAGRALPELEDVEHAPPTELCRAAADMCEERCSEIESSFESAPGPEEEDIIAALLPSNAEWACARALLASPARRAELVRALVTSAEQRTATGAAKRRWREQSACTLTLAAAADAKARDTARELAPLFPDNAFLNLAAACGPQWTGAGGGGGGCGVAEACSDTAALARSLPALLAAPPTSWTPRDADRVYRIVSRASSADCGGALLAVARLEAAARSHNPQPARVLYQALDTLPHSKALHVTGAAWVGAEARALADALLERALRLHALPDELQPLAPPPPTLDTRDI